MLNGGPGYPMALITIRDLTIGFRGPPLLDGVSCQIEPGQRIGLLGRNGAGKTTLMRIICGEAEPDHGQILFAPETRMSLLPQDVPRDIHGTVHEVVASGVPQADREVEAGWAAEHRVEQILSRMSLDADARFEVLSSGMKRRVLLARSLAAAPDILLLDEPTNHLDIDAIEWLERFLLGWTGTLVFVTHDRMFLRNLADRILEIDRGQLFDWSCDYETFLERKEAALAAEEKQDALFDKKLAQEEVWIRQGIKARRTRNEGRVRALEQMRRQRSQRRSAHEDVRLQIQQGLRSGNLVIDADGVSFSYDGRPIVREFSTTIMRGDKVGVIGPNGAGKTTLLRLLLGQLTPEEGSVRLGTNLQIAYFDQLREQLDDDATVAQNVGDGYDSIQIGGKTQHIIGYLQKFLFAPQRAQTPLRFLSGGERNRVLLARLFAKPANVIVLDEPTNDLDAETLELLEQRLVPFEGTVLVVSHDRAFLNNVVTSSIVFEENGVKEYDGGYDDWIRQRAEQPTSASGAGKAKSFVKGKSEPKESPAVSEQPDREIRKRRLSYKEQQELAALPARIEQLETDVSDLHQTMAEPEFYRQPGDQIARTKSLLDDLESQLGAAYERWEILEQRSS